MIREETNPTPRSPFSYFPDERLNILHPRTGTARMPLVLTELDKQLLEMIDQSLVATSNLLHRHMVKQGSTASIHDVRSSLDRLSKHQYLTKMEFITPDRCSLVKIYTLGRYGREYIFSLGRKPRQARYLNTLDSLHCKKLLSAYQFLIGQNSFADARAIEMAPRIQELTEPGHHSDCVFRPQAMVHTADGKTLFILSVRKEPRYLTELTEKLNRMEQTLEPRRRSKLNVQLEKEVEVVLICETAEHMEIIAEGFRDGSLTFDFPVCLTSDQQSYSAPGSCMLRYEGRSRTTAQPKGRPLSSLLASLLGA